MDRAVDAVNLGAASGDLSLWGLFVQADIVVKLSKHGTLEGLVKPSVLVVLQENGFINGSLSFPAKTSFASCVCNPIVSASVPFVVIGEPVTLSVKIPLGTASGGKPFEFDDW